VDDGASVAVTVSAGPGTAAVPDVVGMTRAEAEGALADAGFAPASVMQYDLGAPAGEVVDQLPAGGEQAAVGTQVGVVVSKGRPEVQVRVPDVAGMTQDEATATLAETGLVAVPVEAYSADVPAGSVIEQEPPEGQRVAPLSEVLITVSLGEGATTVTVPDVIGMTKAKAADALVSVGLTVTAAHAWSNDIKKDVVIAQAPKAGEKVEKGGDAGILVSLGPLPSPTATPSPSPSATASAEASPTAEPSASPSESPTAMPPIEGPEPPAEPPELTATVPDVVGMDAGEAQDQLTSRGLRPIPLETSSATAPPGQVIEQLPAAGETVPKTYPVLLLVSTGPAESSEPSL
jgi:beta-lactam-binding protein with PASTA domain